MSTPAGWYPDPSGSGAARYWDGRMWTDHRAAPAADPYALPSGFPGPRRPLNALTDPRNRRMLIVLGAGCLAVLVIYFGFLGRDEASYKAGRAQGEDFGNGVVQAGGPDAMSDGQIRKSCAEMASTAAARSVTYYAPNGEIKGSDVDRGDYTDGCVDGAHAVMGR